ncbi:MAG: hypothetical protein ABI765_15910, partial [Gemmatimonadota bacterium]
VTIPSGTPNSPVIASNALAGSLTVAAGAILDVANGGMTVYGSVSAPGQITGTVTTFVHLVGSGTVSGNFDQIRTIGSPTSYTLNGDINASRSVQWVAGTATIHMNGHTIRTPTITVLDPVEMINPIDSIITTGDQSWQGDETGLLTAGVVSVGGNFTQSLGTHAYAASAGHTTVITGGASSTINMANPDQVTGSHFGRLIVNKTAGSAAIGTTPLSALGMIDVLPGTGQLVSARIEALGVRSTGTATINPAYLQVSLGDSLIVAGPYNVDTTSIGGGNISGAIAYRNLRLGSNSTNATPVTLTDGSLILAGGLFSLGAPVSLVKTGALATDVIIGGGGLPQLDLNGHTLVTAGAFTISPGGTLLMTHAADSLDVAGNATFGGEDEFLKLTAGKLVLRGNLQQLGTAASGSLRALQGHKTIFAGTGNQTVDFADPGQSHFYDLDINKAGGTMVFAPFSEADGVTSLLSPTSMTSTGQYITSGLKVGTGASVNVQVMSLPAGDSLQVNGGSFTALITFFYNGGTIPVGPGIAYQRVDAFGGTVSPGFVSSGDLFNHSGNLGFNGSATIGGDLWARNGQIQLNGNTVLVGGTFHTDSSGVLVMNSPGDSLNVAQDAIFAGGDEQGALTQGTLVIGGNFQQSAITSTTSFAPGGTHRTVFSNPTSSSQNAFFDSPGTTNTGSHFQNLDVSGSLAGINLNVNTIVDGALISSGTGQINGGGVTLTASQLQVSGMTADNVTISLVEQTVLPEQFDNVQFLNMPATGARCLIMAVAGGERFETFKNMTLPTLAIGANNLYVTLTSTNGSTVTLNIQDSNQGGSLGPILSDPPNQTVVNGAEVDWTAS